MVEKKYNIFLEGKILGSTKLEFGDPPMGIVFGQISFVDRNLGYDFIKKYCIDNSIEIQIDYPDEKLITTGIIEKLNIFNSNNFEIKGISITDVNGRLVKNQQGALTQVNVADLNAGVYFVTIEASEGKTTKKFIKQ